LINNFVNEIGRRYDKMKPRLLFLAFLVAFFTINVAFGETFYVTNPDEFQNALSIADSNREDDTINVAEGRYNITSTLYYSSCNGDSGHELTIQGAGADKTVLDGGGSVQILYIDTDADNNGGDSGGDVTIKGVGFNEGFGWGDGGGMYVDGWSINLTIKECAFSKNHTYLDVYGNGNGGGVYVWTFKGTVTITNNTFSRNSADLDGGGVDAYSKSGTITITNNTFSGNSVKYGYGGGVHVRLRYDSATLNIYNNILFGNMANDGDDLYVYSDGDGNYIGSIVNLYNNDFSGNADFDTGQSWDLYITLTDNYHHADNIQKDPQFVDPENGDFHLKSNSPCIDRGNNSAPELPDTDFEGNPRIVGSAPDIGADEYYTGQLIPIPDIKVNGSDGPITLYQNDTLTITVSLNNNGITKDADWWLAAVTPLFDVFFYIRDEGWTGAWVPGYQGPLSYLDSFEVLTMPVSGLRAGTYTLYFGVDTVMDGNVTEDSVYYDTVEVNIIGYSYLLEKYAPVLKFSWGEGYYPTRVENMINNSCVQFKGSSSYFDLFCDGKSTDWDDEQLMSLQSTINQDLDFAVYGRILEKEDRIYLQYWFFYIYNDWKRDIQGVNNHEGDWEMVVVELNQDQTPLRVGYSQHRKIIPKIPLIRGGEVKDWEDLVGSQNIEDETHPVIYVARGSHASYPESGDWNSESGGIEIGEVYHGDGRILRPSNYQLLPIEQGEHWRLIQLDNLRWGMHNDSPPSPVAQGDKWSDPGAWMDSLQ